MTDLAFGKTGITVKICGITREQDAVMASEQGADIIGMVFSNQSPRRAERSLIARVKDHGIAVAGVYTSMADIAKESIEEDYVQMHFPHKYSDITMVKENTGSKVISVIQYKNIDQVMKLIREYREARSDIILIEYRKGISGILQKLSPLMKTYGLGLSGKISVMNIREVMAAKPVAIDLSSSVEAYPGIKDPEKVSGFFSELRRYA